jgi:hypothetical protein
MLSSGLHKVMKTLLILLAAPWITTDANATSEVSTARLDPKRVIERSESAIGRTVGAYRSKNFAAEIDAVRTQQPGKDIQVWFMDEARIGQKGRNGHRWWPMGEHAPGLADKRFVSTYLYAAVRPTTDDAIALVLPEVNADTMDIFLDRVAACLAQNTHAIVLLDQAGWHGEKALAVPVGGAIHSIKSVRIPLLFLFGSGLL